MEKLADRAFSEPLDPALEFLQRLWRLNQALEKLSGRMERRLGITAQQRLVLRCVGKYPRMSAGHLAALLHLDPGTISAALRRLQTKGLLLRLPDPHDGRRVTLVLTTNGRKLDKRAEGTVEHAVQRMLEMAPGRKIDGMASVLDQLTSLLGEELQDTSNGERPGSHRGRVRTGKGRKKGDAEDV